MVRVDPRYRVFFSRKDTLNPEIRLIGWSRFTRADAMALPPHHHGAAYEIHLLTRGRLDLVAGDRVHPIRAGHAFFTAPNEVHSGFDNIIQQSEFYWIQIDSELLEGWQKTILDELVKNRVVRFNDIALYFMEKMLTAHREPDSYSKQAVKAKFDLFLIELGRCLSPDFNRMSDVVEGTVARLRAELDAPPKIQRLAKEAGVSPTQLTMRFRQEVGESIAKWFLHERLDYACELLAQGIGTLEISRRLGYSSAQNFATTFRRELGATPSQFRDIVRQAGGKILPENAPEID